MKLSGMNLEEKIGYKKQYQRDYYQKNKIAHNSKNYGRKLAKIAAMTEGQVIAARKKNTAAAKRYRAAHPELVEKNKIRKYAREEAAELKCSVMQALINMKLDNLDFYLTAPERRELTDERNNTARNNTPI